MYLPSLRSLRSGGFLFLKMIQASAQLADTLQRSAQALRIHPLRQVIQGRVGLLLGQSLLPVIVVGKENLLAI